MSKGDDEFIAGVIGVGAGFLLASQKNSDTTFQKAINDRRSHISRVSIRLPYGLFQKKPNSKIIFREAFGAYLCGLPNVSLPAVIRVLEIALRSKYVEIESKTPPNEFCKLIDWSEKYLGNKKEIAHGFRILRNVVHNDDLIVEADCVEAIRHTSEIMNLLYHYTSVFVPAICPLCKIEGTTAMLFGENCNLGSGVVLECGQCKRHFKLPSVP